MSAVRLRPGRRDEAGVLTELTMRSKAHWGYDQQFLDAVRAELTVRPDDCDGLRLVVAERDDTVLGWYRVIGEPPAGELSDLFVDPSAIGQGLGGRLLRDALRLASELGFVTVTLDADPGAAPFYRHAGARDAGTVPSGSIPGRFLPHLEFDVG